MHAAKALLLSILLSASVQAETLISAWPTKFVPTAISLGYRGKPKSVRISECDGPEYCRTTELNFYRDGRAKKRSSTMGIRDFEIRLDRKGRIKSVLDGQSTSTNTASGTRYEPYSYDGLGRITRIKAVGLEGDGMVEHISSVGVIDISYGDNVRTIDSVDRFADETIIKTRERVREDSHGRVLAMCYGGEVNEPCVDGDQQTDFNEHGPSRFRHGGIETVYLYENGNLVEEVRTNTATQEQLSRIVYSDYETDRCGNWTFRARWSIRAIEGTGSKVTEARAIEYFESCEPARELRTLR